MLELGGRAQPLMTRTLLLAENNVNNIIRKAIEFCLDDIEDLR